MSSVLVTVETGSGGFIGFARQGGREHQATASSPELAARLAGAELLQHSIEYVRAARKEPGIWHVSVSGRKVA